jgi:ribosomal protein S12 methylthiotransferase accessory factor
VTRFADVTRLDTIGIPVWQAIRPWSRSVSVHQGKALDPDAARISCALEAVECACAEAWRPSEVVTAPADELLPELRPPALDGFVRPGAPGNAFAAALDWVPAMRLDGAGEMLVPADFVSLDLTRPAPPRLIRSSNGQGAGDSLERATLKGLCELVERDAFALWARRSAIDHLRSEIAAETVALDWFAELRGRLAEQGVRVRVYRLDGAIDMPILAAELLDERSRLRSRAFAAGTSAHPDAEMALAGAVTEAAQARLGQIAGSRDDQSIAGDVELPNFLGFAIPRPADLPAQDFGAVCAAWSHCAGWTSDDVVNALDAAGFAGTARLAFAPPVAGVHVVKLVNPRLSGRRAARARL